MEPVQRVHVGIQRPRSDSTVPGNGQARRLPRSQIQQELLTPDPSHGTTSSPDAAPRRGVRPINRLRRRAEWQNEVQTKRSSLVASAATPKPDIPKAEPRSPASLWR